jgi:DNA mismatch endonuclease (patch repair protein)
MADSLTPEKRSWLMSRIRSGNTKPELVLRSLLHRCGYRFSLRRRDLPGKPDIVLRKYRTVIFVHGCFWHRHPDCKQASTPRTRTEFWVEKFARNVSRDERNQAELVAKGWRVIVVWECELRQAPLAVLDRVLAAIDPQAASPSYDELPDRREVWRVAEEKLHYRLDNEE